MKPLKRAEQHNVRVNKDFYTVYQLRDMLEVEKVVIFNDNFEPMTTKELKMLCETDIRSEETIIRLFLENVSDIKVVCKEGYYTNVVVVNGEEIFIEL